MKAVYTTPKLCKSSSGWYIWLRFRGKQKRYKANLNRIKNLKEREKHANEIIRVLKQKLKTGWNPFINSLQTKYLFCDALEFALKKKKENISSKTYAGYKSSMLSIIKAIKHLSLDYLYIEDVKRSHLRLILEEVKRFRKWSNKSYNKGLDHLKTVMSELVDWDIIDFNYAYKIKHLKEAESEANRTPTESEFVKIKSQLMENYPEFFVYVATIFHTGIRPGELLKVKIGDVDFETQTIRLKSVITKTNKTRIVPINNHLLELLEDFKCYPDEFYLFGSYREKGKGNVGKYLDFIPGPTKIKTDTSNRRWRKAIKTELGIQVNLYAMKHYGADQKILAGIDLDTLRELYGHTSTRMTERYARKVKEVYRKELIRKSPKF